MVPLQESIFFSFLAKTYALQDLRINLMKSMIYALSQKSYIKKNWPLDQPAHSGCPDKYFSYFSKKTYVVGTH